MKRAHSRLVATALASVVATAGPSALSQAPAGGQTPTVNAADVEFMSGMIPHHAQAVLIAGWAPTHGARSDVRILCERIVVAQKDEIKLMQTWLSDHGQPVPAADATHHVMKMGDVEHKMLMPGMLTDEELARLDKARGPEFDRLFLTFMIKHHQGALTMVETLFESYGGAQEESVFRLASDIWADQQAEIERMQLMLSRGGL